MVAKALLILGEVSTKFGGQRAATLATATISSKDDGGWGRGVAGQAVRCVDNMDGGQTLVAAGDSERGNRWGLAEWARARLRTNVTAMKRTNGYAKRMQSRLRCSRCGSDQCTDGSSAQPASVRQCCSSQWDGWQPEFVGMMWTEDRAQFMRRAQARRRAVCDSGRPSSARPKGPRGASRAESQLTSLWESKMARPHAF